MIKARAWPVRAMYMLIAAALAISLIIIAAPAQKVSADPDLSEWSRVTTPTTDGWVLAPNTTPIDWAVAEGGEVAFAVVQGWNAEEATLGSWLLKSDDHAATWDDITNALVDELDTGDDLSYPPYGIMRVETDGEDADFVAVALYMWDDSELPAGAAEVHVFISTDGGATFTDAGEVEDGPFFSTPSDVLDLAVSPEVGGARDIAIGGIDNAINAALFRCTVVGDTPGSWIDATDVGDYPGWDDTGYPSVFNSDAVTDIDFAPSWAADKTILVVTVTSAVDVHLQSGTWGTSKGWNADSIVAIPAVEIVDNVSILPLGRYIAGVTLPLDYAGRNSDKRYAWVWVNYYDGVEWIGEIFRVKNTAVMSINQQVEDEPILTNVDYVGYISEGKALAGVMGTGTYISSFPADLLEGCGEGVQVYRNDQITNMDICCLPWESACKPPTGIYAMEAFYVSEDKAYAVAMYDFEDGDEGAWSVSFDDGDTWNQLSLVDTYINYLSDVAVSPDCNKTMIVSINTAEAYCQCDSVWLTADDLPEAEEYSGQWLRTWCGLLTNNWGLLRLNPEETTGDTVYLVDYMDDTVYWNEMETLACWDRGTASVSDIVDLAVKDKETIYALDDSGTVAMSDDYALGWQEAVDSKVADGYTIAIWGDDILVGSDDGEVSYSDDGGETFTAMEDVAASGDVTVAFDSYFNTNNTIYAALANAGSGNGIYLWVIDESVDWYKLNAEPSESQIGLNPALGPTVYDEKVDVNFSGLVLDSAAGNPMTGPDTGGVLYASYYGTWDGDDYTGVARCLMPIVEICCDVGAAEWDYLHVGLTGLEEFAATPDALKICGCLTADSNTNLFAIDSLPPYDMDEGLDGAVWTFEDCYAKAAPELVSPIDGFVVPADPCECYNVPFNIMWERPCDACTYDIQFAHDEDFTALYITAYGEEPDTPTDPNYRIAGLTFVCEYTYYWRVRAAESETGQVIHGWWSEPRSFTVAPSVAAAAITLVSPEPGTTGVSTTNVAFSWSLLATADEFDWVLSANADLSAPISTKTGLTTTATTYTGNALENDTPYYWQVTAYNDGVAISMSAIGTFRTATEAEEAPEDEEVVTPVWVWVVIAIGAVLVIVVIVLIFRTRRV